MENKEEELTIDLSEILDIIKKKFWLIISVSLLAAFVSGVYCVYFVKPMYQSQISIVIGKTPSKLQDSSMQLSDVTMFQNMMKTYAVIAQSRNVSQKTLNTLHLSDTLSVEELQKQISVTPESDTQILIIKVKDSDPKVACDKVNALAEAFTDESKRIFPDGNVQTIDAAIIPKDPVSPNKKKDVVVAFLLGMMLTACASILMGIMDNTFKNESELERYIGLPVIGVIPRKLNS